MHDEALFQPILDRPDEDAPRLVYADWLEENGQPERAEFIRVQVALARLPEDDPGRPDLERREQDLLDEYARRWSLPLRSEVRDAKFERGFVGEVTVSAQGFVGHAGELDRLGPVRRVHLFPLQIPVADLARCPALGRLTGLSLATSLGDVEVAALAASPFLAGLSELSLRGQNLGPVGIRALADPRHLPALTSLNLALDAALTGEPIELLHLTGREGLTDLGLLASGLRPPHVEGLFGGRSAARLRRLNLSYNPVGSRGARQLGDAPSLRGLAELRLNSCQLRLAGVHHLTESPYFDRLTVLDLSNNGVRDDGARAVAASPRLTRLRDLRLTHNDIGPFGVAALAGCPRLGRLRSLDLSGNPLHQDGAAEVVGTEAFHGLRALKLNDAHLGTAGVKALARAELPELTHLELDTNSAGDEGLKAVVGSPSLGRLTTLDFRGNAVTAAGAEWLLRSPLLARFRRIDLSKNLIRESERQALKARCGRRVILS